MNTMYQLPQPKAMSKNQIVAQADELWEEYVREVGWRYVVENGIKFDDVYEALIYPKYEIILEKNEYLGVDDFGDPILGQFIPKEKTALISKQLFESNDPRVVFTEWHEVCGHGILHGSLLRKSANRLLKLNTTQKAIDDFFKYFESRFEWQANVYAANIGAPKILVACMYIKLFNMKHRFLYRGADHYTLHFCGRDFRFYIGSLQELGWQIGRLMKHRFGGLSAECLSYQVLDAVIDSKVENKSANECDFVNRVGNVIEGMNIL